ncbi:MAG: recombination mediator RecR [Rickettsiales bacterium]|jgi:recombination protein RecR|nr:recombination mediator RecR [Rickettsiales bacterium]
MTLLDKLILQFSRLPRVGRRAAGRIVIGLLSDKSGRGKELADTLSVALSKIRPCVVCGCLTENDLCDYCNDRGRLSKLCIVRDFSDVLVLEKSGVFHGRYHIIGGLLSGANGVVPDDLFIKNISERIITEKIDEVIFALPNTLEGKTTQGYIAAHVQMHGADMYELASGVPMGGDLDYIDDGTLALAFEDKKRL